MIEYDAPTGCTTPSTSSGRRVLALWAGLTVVALLVVYLVLAVTLGITGLLIAVVLWLIALVYGVTQRTPRGNGIALGCALALAAGLVGFGLSVALSG